MTTKREVADLRQSKRAGDGLEPIESHDAIISKFSHSEANHRPRGHRHKFKLVNGTLGSPNNEKRHRCDCGLVEIVWPRKLGDYHDK